MIKYYSDLSGEEITGDRIDLANRVMSQMPTDENKVGDLLNLVHVSQKEYEDLMNTYWEMEREYKQNFHDDFKKTVNKKWGKK